MFMDAQGYGMQCNSFIHHCMTYFFIDETYEEGVDTYDSWPSIHLDTQVITSRCCTIDG